MQAMTSAISNAGIFYVITSSYRSYETQIHTYNYWYTQTGYDRTATDLKSARPGYSEHQLGVTVDFASNQTNFVRGSSLDNWLKAHAHEYGYVMSYPEGKQDITGYQYEPWHYRYVGVDAAIAIKDSGLTPTEWLYDHWNK
jgi:D-alanyl-D-alanine carboxypeptidase